MKLLTVDANEGCDLADFDGDGKLDIGAGLQIRTGDLDADGDLGIVAAGKDGTQILFNRGGE